MDRTLDQLYFYYNYPVDNIDIQLDWKLPAVPIHCNKAVGNLFIQPFDKRLLAAPLFTAIVCSCTDLAPPFIPLGHPSDKRYSKDTTEASNSLLMGQKLCLENLAKTKKESLELVYVLEGDFVEDEKEHH